MTSHKDNPFRVTGGKTDDVCIGGLKRRPEVMVRGLQTFSSDYFSFCSDMGSKILVGAKVVIWDSRRV